MQATLNYPQITVVTPQGSLNEANALEFQQNLTQALTQNAKSILLVDLKAIESIDSSGLMALVSALKLAQDLGRRLVLGAVSPSVRIILEVTQLDKVFEIFEH
ncbi:MAG: STAS domain-containing protein [Nostocaceae cyanobacterium]|nr:STAS domain-containing protein [Nostocaceae cyanobacterium]